MTIARWRALVVVGAAVAVVLSAGAVFVAWTNRALVRFEREIAADWALLEPHYRELGLLVIPISGVFGDAVRRSPRHEAEAKLVLARDAQDARLTPALLLTATQLTDRHAVGCFVDAQARVDRSLAVLVEVAKTNVALWNRQEFRDLREELNAENASVAVLRDRLNIRIAGYHRARLAFPQRFVADYDRFLPRFPIEPGAAAACLSRAR